MELKTPVGAPCHDAQDQPRPWLRNSKDSHSQVRGHNVSGPSEAHRTRCWLRVGLRGQSSLFLTIRRLLELNWIASKSLLVGLHGSPTHPHTPWSNHAGLSVGLRSHTKLIPPQGLGTHHSLSPKLSPPPGLHPVTPSHLLSCRQGPPTPQEPLWGSHTT